MAESVSPASAETGHVYFTDRIAGRTVKCTLDVVGTGMNAEGNPTLGTRGSAPSLDSAASYER
jgi:hypothetical protein